MNDKEILKFCLEKGILLDKEVLSLFKELEDVNSVKTVLEKVKTQTQQRIITKKVFSNQEQTKEFFLNLPEESQKKLKIKLGLIIEISKEVSLDKGKIEAQKEDLSDSFSKEKFVTLRLF